MIRLRAAMDRALEHRWLGPLVILVLVVMLVFVVIHTGIDAAHDEVGLACLALAAVIVGLLVWPRERIDATRLLSPVSRRGPPAGCGRAGLPFVLQAIPPPLRL